MKKIVYLLISIGLFIIKPNICNAYAGSPRGWYLSPGVALAMNIKPKIIAGGELSFCYLWEPGMFYLGSNFEVVYDDRIKTVRNTIGVEFGWWIVGFDGGLLIEYKNKEIGFNIRPYLILPLFTIWGGQIKDYKIYPNIIIYYRFNKIFNSLQSHEIGLMFKCPIWIK